MVKDAVGKRAVKVTLSVESGDGRLDRAAWVADKLWNETWWCAIGFNRQLQRARGDWGSLKGKLPPYPGFYNMDKDLRDHWAFRELSDRVATYIVREFDANMRSWFSNLKSNADARPPRPSHNGRVLSFEVGRNAKHLGNWRFQLAVFGGATPKQERYCVAQVHVRPGVQVRDVRLVRVMPGSKDGRYEAILIVDAVTAVSPGDAVAALDLGIVNLGVLALSTGESILYPGGALLDVQRHYAKRKAACKPPNWRKGVESSQHSEREKSYSQKQANIMRLAIHNFTTHVIRECAARGVGRLAVGDLTGIRTDKDFGAVTNQKLHAWPFRKITEQLKYKGEDYGIEVIQASEAYTSQTCAACGNVDKRSRVERGLYRCRACGAELNADLNGAINFLKKTFPEVSPGVKPGVDADFPGVRSTGTGQGTREVATAPFANHPDFVAKFDLRNYSLTIAPTHSGKSPRSQWASPVLAD